MFIYVGNILIDGAVAFLTKMADQLGLTYKVYEVIINILETLDRHYALSTYPAAPPPSS